jgi:pyruvate dehydrogenase E1 component beta subunit
MFAGQMKVPMVIRMIIGRGWGQGAQHSQSLQAWFAHVPGLKVVMPATSYDAKGMLIASIEDNNPVIFIEHRWLYNITGEVPQGIYRVPIGQPRIAREGKELTIVSISYMTLEALRAADMLAKDGVSAEVIDLRTLRPLDDTLILESVQKTGRLIVADTAWKTGGFGAEIISQVSEKAFQNLKSAPVRIALPDCPTPTTRALTNKYYPRAVDIAKAAKKMLGHKLTTSSLARQGAVLLDIPDKSFTGPF